MTCVCPASRHAATVMVAVLTSFCGCRPGTPPPAEQAAPTGTVSAVTPAVSPAPVAAPREMAPWPIDRFLEVAMAGDVEKVGKALANGTDANAANGENRTALMMASFNGHTRVVELLLDAGARVNTRDAMKRTALMFASTGPNADTVALLLKHKAEVNAIDGHERWTALMFAAAEGQQAVVDLLLKHDADVTMRDTDGDTAANFAAQRGHQALAEQLKPAAENAGN